MAADGSPITGIVMLQEARITVDKGNVPLLNEGKKVYRRVGIVNDNAEIDAMTFLSKKDKSNLIVALSTGTAVPLVSLDIVGDKSLLRDDSGMVARKNLVKGIIIPEGGARRLSYNYMSRDQLREDIPQASKFKKENKNLIKDILKDFVSQSKIDKVYEKVERKAKQQQQREAIEVQEQELNSVILTASLLGD